jgi:DNA-binding SARP family transcriptional activator
MKDKSKEIAPADLVEMDFLEKVMVRLPQDVDVLEALGDLYTRVGRYEDGLEVDRKLTQLEPDDMTIWYNLACSLAVLNRRGPALQALRRAVDLGYSDHEWMSRDQDLDSLREDREFKTLLKGLANPVTKSTRDF